jgi:hypothetical protein
MTCGSSGPSMLGAGSACGSDIAFESWRGMPADTARAVRLPALQATALHPMVGGEVQRWLGAPHGPGGPPGVMNRASSRAACRTGKRVQAPGARRLPARQFAPPDGLLGYPPRSRTPEGRSHHPCPAQSSECAHTRRRSTIGGGRLDRIVVSVPPGRGAAVVSGGGGAGGCWGRRLTRRTCPGEVGGRARVRYAAPPSHWRRARAWRTVVDTHTRRARWQQHRPRTVVPADHWPADCMGDGCAEQAGL